MLSLIFAFVLAYLGLAVLAGALAVIGALIFGTWPGRLFACVFAYWLWHAITSIGAPH